MKTHQVLFILVVDTRVLGCIADSLQERRFARISPSDYKDTKALISPSKVIGITVAHGRWGWLRLKTRCSLHRRELPQACEYFLCKYHHRATSSWKGVGICYRTQITWMSTHPGLTWKRNEVSYWVFKLDPALISRRLSYDCLIAITTNSRPSPLSFPCGIGVTPETYYGLKPPFSIPRLPMTHTLIATYLSTTMFNIRCQPLNNCTSSGWL